MSGSGATPPFACGTPFAIRAARSVRALPTSFWLQAMSYFLPSSEVDLVRPVSACLVAVWGAELGRGAWADIDALFLLRRPRVYLHLLYRNAACEHVILTDWVSAVLCHH